MCEGVELRGGAGRKEGRKEGRRNIDFFLRVERGGREVTAYVTPQS